MIDGIWWLVILLAMIAILWIWGKSRGADSEDNAATSTKGQPNDALQKTATRLKRDFTDYRVERRAHHLVISKHGTKIAMITFDKAMPVGSRRLGEVPIINYHRVPNRAQLSANLQNIE